MSEIIKEIFWRDLKDDIKFFLKNFKRIIKRTWSDLLKEFKMVV